MEVKKERYSALSAVMLMLTRDGQDGEEILLQKRKNTGFADGFYDCCASGHVEEGESMKIAMCREAKEELGIDIGPEDLEFICLIHKNLGGKAYYNGYFKGVKWFGEPCINEPEKSEELRWCRIDELPDNTIDDRKTAVTNYLKGIRYSESGWDI